MMLSCALVEGGMREVSPEDREVPGQSKDKSSYQSLSSSKDLRSHSRRGGAVLGNVSPAENECKGLCINACSYSKTECCTC